MIRMIPNVISPEVKSQAERKLFNEFKCSQSDDGIAILHSLGIAEHSNNVFGEIDFVIICRRGILCVEVKGGTVERSNARWSFTNRYGKRETKQEGPFEQAQGNMQSLRAYLKRRLGDNSPIVRSQFAACVIMPDCIFKYDGIDIIKDVLFDNSFQWNLFDIIERSFLFWSELCFSKHGFKGGMLSESEIKLASDLLRGDFRFVPSLKEAIHRTVQELCALTDEQYLVLEALGDNERTLVSGMAGTGKTLLATEQCRRKFCAGKSVLYVCYNHNISQYIKNLFERENLIIEASTLHSLIMKICGEKWALDKGFEYYNDKLPELFLNQKNRHRLYDYVVVDEGQDLLSPTYLKCLNALIDGGIKNGCWSIFFDPNQNIFNPRAELYTVLSQLREVSAKYSLSINCRNTRQIANANTLMTNMPQAGIIKAIGPEVKYFKYTSLAEELDMVVEQLRKIQEDGVIVGDVLLMSTYKSSNNRCCLSCGNIPLDVGKIKLDGFIWSAKKNEIRFSTISAFKGLESKIVFLLDVDSFSVEQRRLMNYVAISRACAVLYVFYDTSAEDGRQHMMATGYPKLIKQNR